MTFSQALCLADLKVKEFGMPFAVCAEHDKDFWIYSVKPLAIAEFNNETIAKKVWVNDVR